MTSLKRYSGADMAVIPSKKDLGAQLTEKLNRAFDEQYNMAIAKGARQPRTDYDANTDTYRTYTTGGIETWHAKGAEHYLVQQLEQRLEKMEQNHKRDMTNLANQVMSMNNAVEARVQHINGFYTWLIETYPETVAQYKALLDLKRLTEGEE
jgi:hypothetical protein